MDRIGFAKVIRKLVKNDTKAPITLGGYQINNADYMVKTTNGDGDVIIQAINSAIIGSLELNTVGGQEYEGYDVITNGSAEDFLVSMVKAMRIKRNMLRFFDICIVCDKLMLREHLLAIRNHLTNMTGVYGVGIKCTNFADENNETIECYATLSISRMEFGY